MANSVLERLPPFGDWLAQAVELNPNGVMYTLDYTRVLLLAERTAEAETLLRPIPRGLHPSVSVFLAQSLIFQERFEEARAVVEEGRRHFPGTTVWRSNSRSWTTDVSQNAALRSEASRWP